MSLYIRARDDEYNDEIHVPGSDYYRKYNFDFNYKPGLNDPVVPMFSSAQKKKSSEMVRPYKPVFDSSKAAQAMRRGAALQRQADLRATATALRRKPAGMVYDGRYAPQFGPQNRRAAENNYVDVAVVAKAVDTTGTIALLNTVAQGASINQRIGKKYFLKSCQMRGEIANNAAATYGTCVVLLVWDTKPTGSLPAITDILVSASSYSFNNDNNTDRFRILRRYDNVLVGAPSATTGTSDSAKNMDDFIKINKPVICKAAGTGAIGDIEEGALYCVTVGSAAAGTSASVANLGFRIRYTDM